MTPQEAEAFEQQQNIELNDENVESSQKNNLYIFAQNFLNLNTYLATLKAYSVYVKSLISVDTLVNQVLAKILTDKASINIPFSIAVGQTITQVVNLQTYSIRRVNNYLVEITNLTLETSWIVDKLMVQIKNNEGVFINATIKATQNKIQISFHDSIQTGYVVLFM